jgi:hypothetical protein
VVAVDIPHALERLPGDRALAVLRTEKGQPVVRVPGALPGCFLVQERAQHPGANDRYAGISEPSMFFVFSSILRRMNAPSKHAMPPFPNRVILVSTSAAGENMERFLMHIIELMTLRENSQKACFVSWRISNRDQTAIQSMRKAKANFGIPPKKKKNDSPCESRFFRLYYYLRGENLLARSLYQRKL